MIDRFQDTGLLALIRRLQNVLVAGLLGLVGISACSAELVQDLKDGRLDQYSLLQAAGQIATVDTAKLAWLEQRVAHLAQQSNAHGAADVHFLLNAIHDRLLTGHYHTDASQISSVIEIGDYNCVSSTLVFLATVRQAGFSAKPVLLPGHVRCRVWLPLESRWVDIEPSVRSGHSERATNRSSGPQLAREITDVQLLAKLYYNLGIDKLRENDYREALRNAARGWKFDQQHEEAADNVIAIINNWSIVMCREHRFDDAIRLIHASQTRAPHPERLRDSELHAYVAWMRASIDRGDVAGVQSTLSEALERFPKSPLLRSIQNRVSYLPNHSGNSSRQPAQ